MCKTPSQKMTVRVKETVDFIFELLHGNDWVEFSMSSIDIFTNRICYYLMRRGIVERRKGNGKKFEYRWAATMAPTKFLYDNIVADRRADKRDDNARRVKRRREQKKREAEAAAPVVAPEPEPIPEIPDTNVPVPPANPLESFSIKELWDELKRRGCTIENNRLVRKEIYD